MKSPVASITDDQLAELAARLLETQERRYSTLMSHEWLSGLIARLRAAEAVCDDLRPDAERYRWLRDEANNTREDAPQVLITDWSGSPVSIQPWAYPQGEKLDQAIDAAMERKA